MSEPSNNQPPDWEQLRAKVIGLGERSFHKSYYPQLLQQIAALEAERAKAEENERKFRTLFEHISDGILLIDLTARTFYLGNQAFFSLVGYSSEECEQLVMDDLFPEEDVPWIEVQFLKQMRGEIKIIRDVPVIRKDGSQVYLDINSTAVNMEDRELTLFVLRDVTERRQADAALEKAYLDTVLALSRMMDARDAYTGNHSQNLAIWAKQVAERLGCSKDEIRTIHWAALLHDIGKIGVPDEILRKPASLTEPEWQVMRRHPEIGAEVIAPVKQLNGVAAIIRAHHERFDGLGYPDGLKGEEIPLGGRILTIVDAYGAITDDRVYRKSRTSQEAVEELKLCAEKQFDPRIIQVFLEVLHDDPTALE